jgi:hypothetical protein
LIPKHSSSHLRGSSAHDRQEESARSQLHSGTCTSRRTQSSGFCSIWFDKYQQPGHRGEFSGGYKFGHIRRRQEIRLSISNWCERGGLDPSRFYPPDPKLRRWAASEPPAEILSVFCEGSPLKPEELYWRSRDSSLRSECVQWCERGDSNPHGFTRQILSLVRLPIPPLSQVPRLLYCKRICSSRAKK